MEGTDKRREEIYAVSVRAGKRTYFFDVKETRQGDYYLTITESKKVFDKDGNSRFEKHKIFLYKEDFAKFQDGFTDVVGYIKRHKPEFFEQEAIEKAAEAEKSEDTETE
ncbi:MAG: DNA-binding protein [Marinilabiliales bacterium]|nr:MAG: DNA-binding protein [Marinilabiliales bacterium]